ncbi:MAG TPA: DUF3526 domain-containing protein [Duganella sp.]|jgi:ABC-2 type transport system permease protein
MRRAPFWALFRIEVKLLLASRFSWILGALLFGAMWWGAVNGQHQARAQQATIDRIASHVEGRLADQQAAVARYRQPAPAQLPYWQDPSDVSGYMRYGLEAHAVKPPLPLAGLAIGQSRLLPFYMKTDLDYVAPPGSAFDFTNPRFLALGEFDFAFVLVVILPLAVIALGGARLAAERDSGALLLMLAQLPSFRRLVMLKFGALAAVCVPFAVAAALLALMAAGVPLWQTPEPGTMLSLLVASAGLTLFWVALTTLVASRSGVVGSYLRLISIWVVFTFVVPAAGALLIAQTAPAPAALAYLDQLRRIHNMTPSERDAVFTEYVSARPEYSAIAARITSVSYATKQIAVQQAVERRSAKGDAAMARAMDKAATQAGLVAWLSPAMVFDSMLQQAAGTGIERHREFLLAARAYTERLRAFFWPRALAEAARPTQACPGCAGRMNFTAHREIPRFEPAPPANGMIPGGGAALYMWGLAALAGLLLWRGKRLNP